MAPSSGSARQCDSILLQGQNSPIYARASEQEGERIVIQLCNQKVSLLDHLYVEMLKTVQYSWQAYGL